MTKTRLHELMEHIPEPGGKSLLLQVKIFGCKLKIFGCKLKIFGCKLKIFGCKLKIFERSPAADAGAVRDAGGQDPDDEEGDGDPGRREREVDSLSPVQVRRGG